MKYNVTLDINYKDNTDYVIRRSAQSVHGSQRDQHWRCYT